MPVGGSPRAVWKARSVASVAAVNFPPAGTGSVASKERRCCCSQMTWSPREPLESVGQPGSVGTTVAGADALSAAHVASLEA